MKTDRYSKAYPLALPSVEEEQAISAKNTKLNVKNRSIVGTGLAHINMISCLRIYKNIFSFLKILDTKWLQSHYFIPTVK